MCCLRLQSKIAPDPYDNWIELYMNSIWIKLFKYILWFVQIIYYFYIFYAMIII